jgi:hypothetical protein
MSENNYSGTHYVFVDEVDFDELMECSRDKRLRNVKYVDKNRKEDYKSVWQGDRIDSDMLNDNYNLPVGDIDNDEVFMLEGRFVKPNYNNDDMVESKIIIITKRYIAKKENDNKVKFYQLSYREAVEECE